MKIVNWTVGWLKPRWKFAALLLFTSLVMVPRLLSASFGLFDDPTTLATASEILAGKWSPAMEAVEGRYRPLYWFYNTAIFAIFGANPGAYFFANALLLITLVALLHRLLKGAGFNGWAIWSAALSLLISGPLLENAYTLSKPELLQVTLLAGLLTINVESVGQVDGEWRWERVGTAALVALLACLTKETGVILVPLSLCIFLVMRLLIRMAWVEPAWGRFATQFLTSSLFGVASYVGIRLVFAPLRFLGRGYSGGFDFGLSNMLLNTKVLLDVVSRDYLYLIPLGLLALLSLRRVRIRAIPWLAISGTWAIIWFVLYVPWKFTQFYYLAPFALGVSLFVGTCVQAGHWLIKEAAGWRRAAVVPLAILAGLFFLANTANQATTARLQLEVDSANDRMLNTVSSEMPAGSTLLVNIQDPNEYFYQLKDSLSLLKGRDDLKVQPVSHNEHPETGQKSVYYLLPVFRNQFYPSYRMGVYEKTSREWNSSLKAEVSGLDEPEFRVRAQFYAFLVDPLRLFCPFSPNLPYCEVPNTPFDTRPVSYGWDLYSMSDLP